MIQDISIHALLAESDRINRNIANGQSHFYPRSPCGERPLKRFPPMCTIKHFYPRSPCGERLIICLSFFMKSIISIHALLAESDLFRQNYECFEWIFLSTLSLRRATLGNAAVELPMWNFYPRSPCGERLKLFAKRFCNSLISIHALLAESDSPLSISCMILTHFYPRSPCGERHLATRQSNYLCGNFYPRSPCGERQRAEPSGQAQSLISIHALLAESDFIQTKNTSKIENFYPRSPCGERPTTIITICIVPRFLSTLSLRRATLDGTPPLTSRANFYPRSPCGERLLAARWVLLTQIFLSTLSLRRATK